MFMPSFSLHLRDSCAEGACNSGETMHAAPWLFVCLFIPFNVLCKSTTIVGRLVFRPTSLDVCILCSKTQNAAPICSKGH
jgi:hypothetical protein